MTVAAVEAEQAAERFVANFHRIRQEMAKFIVGQQEVVEQVLHLCGVVLVMTVNPGFGRQKFLPEVLPKVRDLRRLCQSKSLDPRTEVDSGQNGENAALAIEAGANVIVAGFGSDDYAATISRIRNNTLHTRCTKVVAQ